MFGFHMIKVLTGCLLSACEKFGEQVLSICELTAEIPFSITTASLASRLAMTLGQPRPISYIFSCQKSTSKKIGEKIEKS